MKRFGMSGFTRSGLFALASGQRRGGVDVVGLPFSVFWHADYGRIDDISRMERVLDEMTARRAVGSVPDCPILEAPLDGGDEDVCL